MENVRESVSIVLKPEEIIKLTMIVTDEDKDEALNFLKGVEKRIRGIREGHCEPKLGRS